MVSWANGKLVGGLAMCVFGTTTASPNVTVELNMNNVKGMVGKPGVVSLGVFSNLAACENECLLSSFCVSFTWYHQDFPKPEYQGHCYAHTDNFWNPMPQDKIDSGIRNSVPTPAPVPTPPPTLPGSCTTGADCSGFNGDCVSSKCVCHKGWKGDMCGEVKWVKGKVVPVKRMSLSRGLGEDHQSRMNRCVVVPGT